MRYFMILLMMSLSSVATEYDLSWSGVIPASITFSAAKNHSLNLSSIDSKEALEQLIKEHSQLSIVSHKYKTMDIHMVTMKGV